MPEDQNPTPNANTNTPPTPPPATPPAPKAEEGRSFLDDGAGDLPAASDWPADFRSKFAEAIPETEREAFLKMAERIGSPVDVAKNLWESQKEIRKLRTGGAKKLSDTPSPEELEAYRKENNIPLKPEDYDLSLPDGLVIGEDDKPMVMEIIKELHGKNANPDMVKTMLSSYYKLQDANNFKFHEAEKLHKQETVEALRAELGPEYTSFRNSVIAFLGKQPDGIGDILSNARDANGRALLNTPSFAKWLGGLVKELDPSATIASLTGGSGASVEDEIAKIQTTIRDNPDVYYKDAKMQKRMEDLVAARDKNKKAA